MMQDVKKVDTISTLSKIIVAPVLCRNAFSCLGENFLASLTIQSTGTWLFRRSCTSSENSQERRSQQQKNISLRQN
jgi:hypothetical protein